MIGLVLMRAVLSMSNDEEMIILIVILLIIMMTVISLHGFHQFYGLVQAMKGFAADSGKRGVELQGLLVGLDLQGLVIVRRLDGLGVLDGLAVSLVECDLPFVVSMLERQVVVVIVVEIREGF